MAKLLDREEEEQVALLARAGLAPSEAKVFAALARGSGHSAIDLASVTGLARQEAGDAGNALAQRGLARVEKVPSGPSGGRPTNRYFLVGEGLAALLRARRAAIADELAALDELETRFGVR